MLCPVLICCRRMAVRACCVCILRVCTACGSSVVVRLLPTCDSCAVCLVLVVHASPSPALPHSAEPPPHRPAAAVATTVSAALLPSLPFWGSFILSFCLSRIPIPRLALSPSLSLEHDGRVSPRPHAPAADVANAAGSSIATWRAYCGPAPPSIRILFLLLFVFRRVVCAPIAC